MKLAIGKVRNREMSVREAADTFSVPRSSVGDRLTKLKEGEMVIMTPNMGWFRRTFTDELEEKLVSHTKDLDSRLMPLTRKEFCILAYKLAENLKIPLRFNKKKCAGKTILIRIYEEARGIILENFRVN
jgi:Mn-dependent DtxR family transcriptional regulator